MSEQSLADRAVEALAAVRAMDAGVELTHPERHAVRDLKRAAEAILDTALRQAYMLTHAAQNLSEDMRKKEKESASAQKGSNDDRK